jgi:hypothetical protein
MKILFWSSVLFFIPTVIYGVYLKKWNYTFMVSCVMCTSLNHHRNPLTTGFRRRIDHVTVWTVLMYQQWYCNVYHIDPIPCTVLNAIGIFYYIIAKITKNNYYHVLLHLLGNIGNIYVLSC